MPEAPRYWSEAFIEAYVEALNADAGFQKIAKHTRETLIFRCLDAPTGEGGAAEDVHAAYRVEKGTVTVEVDRQTAPAAWRGDGFKNRDALARATAGYATWVEVDTGKLTPLAALASPDYTVEGSKIKIAMNMGLINGMGDVAKTVDKAY
jgi:putative sterol carrier protein